MPLLQRELLQCAQMAKQTPPQYLRQHEDILSERDTTPLDPEEMNPLEINENGKRKASSEGLRYITHGACTVYIHCTFVQIRNDPQSC